MVSLRRRWVLKDCVLIGYFEFLRLCVNGTTHADAVSPFIGNGTPGTMVLFTLGFLSLICVVVPLATMDLNDNIVIQFGALFAFLPTLKKLTANPPLPLQVSFLVLFAIVIFWFSIFLADPLTPSLVPAIGPSAGSLVGNVLANYAFVTTVPSWLGVKHPKVGVHRAVLISLGAALVLYMGIGIVGGMWKEISTSSDLLTAIDNMVINIIFPLFTLVTSIPVNIISKYRVFRAGGLCSNLGFAVIRANLVQAKVCGRGWAMFWAAIFPFLICIPLQVISRILGGTVLC